MKEYTPTEARDIYLDWFNNFISTEALAEHYGISQTRAHWLIAFGKRIHENTVDLNKSVYREDLAIEKGAL